MEATEAPSSAVEATEAPSSPVEAASSPAGAPAPADEIDGEDEEAGWWSFAGVPRLTYSVDDGFGLGARGAAFWHRYGTSPYKTAVSFQVWVTTNLVQQHYVRVDAIDSFGQPLRLTVEAGYFASLAQNIGNTKVRIDEPYAEAVARFRVDEQPKIELVAGDRLAVYLGGAVEDELLAGATFDTRDFEPSPTKGIFAALIARAPVVAGVAGVNAEVNVYAPLTKARDVVLASRLMLDVITTEHASAIDLAKTGGLKETFAFGGQELGRGLASSRLIGPVKAMAQHELRFDFLHVDIFDNDLGVGAATFIDVGAVGDYRAAPALAFGTGIGTRLAWNKSFITRFDVAVSPVEGPRIAIYTALGNTF